MAAFSDSGPRTFGSDPLPVSLQAQPYFHEPAEKEPHSGMFSHNLYESNESLSHLHHENDSRHKPTYGLITPLKGASNLIR